MLHYVESISPVQRHRHHLSGVQLICQLYFIKRHDLLQFNDHHIGMQYVNNISFTCQSQCCKHWCCKPSHHSPSWIYQWQDGIALHLSQIHLNRLPHFSACQSTVKQLLYYSWTSIIEECISIYILATMYYDRSGTKGCIIACQKQWIHWRKCIKKGPFHFF